MKNPCKDCLVSPACTIGCNDYNRFIKFLRDTIAPIMVLLSCLICAGFMSFLIFSEYKSLFWIYLFGSWLGWIAIEDDTGFIDTLMAPFFLPATIGMRVLKRKYKSDKRA